MRRTVLYGLTAVLLLPATARAQEHMGQMQHDHGVGMAAIRPHYERFRDWLVETAEMVPEEHYGYQPTSDVRTVGQLVGHLANAGYLFCSNVLGEDNPNQQDFENVTSRADLIAALKESFAYCDRAYAIDEMKAMEQTTFFGNEGSRLWVLNFNAVHISEHYGNLVTYMRLNGIVPPSSAGNE